MAVRYLASEYFLGIDSLFGISITDYFFSPDWDRMWMWVDEHWQWPRKEKKLLFLFEIPLWSPEKWLESGFTFGVATIHVHTKQTIYCSFGQMNFNENTYFKFITEICDKNDDE